MQVESTDFNGIKVVTERLFYDERGYFSELFKFSAYSSLDAAFVQDNYSFSQTGVIRGLHLQVAPYAQGKFVRCIVGRIFDVAVDVRPNSRTYGRAFTIELSSENGKGVYLPPGFLHGFQALEPSYVLYKCTAEYSPTSERGIRYDDSQFAIQWPIKNGIVSQKDLALPSFDHSLAKDWQL